MNLFDVDISIKPFFCFIFYIYIIHMYISNSGFLLLEFVFFFFFELIFCHVSMRILIKLLFFSGCDFCDWCVYPEFEKFNIILAWYLILQISISKVVYQKFNFYLDRMLVILKILWILIYVICYIHILCLYIYISYIYTYIYIYKHIYIYILMNEQSQCLPWLYRNTRGQRFYCLAEIL